MLKRSPKEIFRAVSDSKELAMMLPGIHTVEVDNSKAEVPGGKGCVRVCTFEQGMALTEDIRYWDPGTAYAYSVRAPNPVGVENHVAVFHVADDGHGGTLLTWNHYFDHMAVEQAVPAVNAMMTEILGKLIASHGGQLVASN